MKKRALGPVVTRRTHKLARSVDGMVVVQRAGAGGISTASTTCTTPLVAAMSAV